MSKVSPWLARSLAEICAFLFGFTLLAALLLVNTQARLFESATYKNALQSQNFYQRMPKLLADQITASLAGSQPGQPGGYLDFLSAPDWEGLITALIPPQQLQAVTEQSLDSVFDFLNRKNENPVIVITPIKQTLAANGEQTIHQILGTQPACTEEQISNLSLSLMLGQPFDKNMLCNPPQEFLSLAMPLVSGLFDAQIAAIPDTIPLFVQNRLELRARLDNARMLMRLSPLLPLIFLALLTLFAVRSWESWLKWWGLPITISAALSLLVALAAGTITRLAILYAASRGSSVYALRLAASTLDVVQAIINQVTLPMAIEAAVLLLAGAGMLTGAWVVGRKKIV